MQKDPRANNVEQEREEQLDDRLRVGAGGVHHPHAPGFAGRQIDRVEPDTSSRDDAELLGGVEQLIGDRRI